jgi:hypothetical protein
MLGDFHLQVSLDHNVLCKGSVLRLDGVTAMGKSTDTVSLFEWLLDILPNGLHNTSIITSHKNSRGSKIRHMLPISGVKTNRHILHEDIVIAESRDGSIRDQAIGLGLSDDNGLLGGHVGILVHDVWDKKKKTRFGR